MQHPYPLVHPSHLCLVHSETQLVDGHPGLPMTRPTTIHFAEVVQGQDFIMRVGTLYFPALMCNSLVFILYWGEEHLVTQEGGMPGTEGEGGDTLGPRTLGHRMQ